MARWIEERRLAEPITVLHVDDDEGFLNLVRDLVQETDVDLSIISVQDGDTALETLSTNDEIECVLSDYEMPSLDGLELLEIVRERWPNLPFIMYTGQGSEDRAERAINAGVTEYFQKSASLESVSHVANSIREAVEDYRTEALEERLSTITDVEFELLVDSVEDYAIFFLDPEGYIRTWNTGAEHIKGYTEDEILGEHLSIFYPEEDVESGVPERNLRRATDAGRVHDEGWRLRKDGSAFWADVTITAIHEGGELIGFAKITRDNTQRHEEQATLERKEQLEELVMGISHDLRSPISVALGNAQLARENEDFERLEATINALGRAGELLEYLRTLAVEGKQLLELESVDLQAVVEDAWSALEPGDATLVCEDSAIVVADEQRLRQVFQNLLNNAIEHGGPQVAIRVGPLEDRDGFYVEDDGPGIPPEARNEVFEIGYSGRHEVSGSGFGLAICQHIAEAHEWTIEVTEGAEGGARFEITGVTHE